MNKQIIFITLVITSTIAQGMKRSANIFQNNDTANKVGMLLQDDLLPQFTADICSSHNYQPKAIKKNIGTLSLTNRCFRDYYALEKTKQEIIDLCLPYHNSNSKNIAYDLGYYSIHAKIEHFTNIVRNKKKNFSQNDLEDPWYLAVTTTYEFDYNIYQEPLNQSLLYVAIDHGRIEKAITILQHTKDLHFSYGEFKNPLLAAVQQRLLFENYQLFQGNSKQYLAVIQGLLQKRINPNGREKESQCTPLGLSVKHADKEVVKLLLEHDADPYLTEYDTWNKKTENAFDLEPKKGWLQKIIDEVNTNKNNHNK